MKEKSRNFRKDMSRAIGFLRENTLRYFLGAMGFTLLVALFSVIRSIAAKYMVNAAIAHDAALFYQTLAITAVCFLFFLVFTPIFSWWYNSSAKYTGKYIKMNAYEHMLTLPYQYFLKNHTGSIVSKLVNDSDTFVHLFGSRLRRFFAPILMSVISGIGLIIIDRKLGAMLIVLNTLAVVVNTLFSNPIRRLSDSIQQNLSSMTEKVFDLFSGFLVIRIFNIQTQMSREYAEINSRLSSDSRKRINWEGGLDSLNYVFRILSTFGTVVVGSLLLAQKLTDPGTLIALISLQGMFSNSLLDAARNMPMLHYSLAGACRIFSFLDEPQEKKRDLSISLSSVESLELKNVAFSYSDDKEILQNISLKAKKGETIALVGSSGSGKSTILKILAGLIEPSKGNVLFNGVSVEDIPRETLWDQISYVSQQSVLFDGTIEENIRSGNLDSSKEEIEQAARNAAAHDFIADQSRGYNSQVGERGIKLSGGQMQRIAIARALVKKSSIFLFDEATSSLDSRSEQIVQDNFETSFNNGICLIIAHRLSTIQHADRIYVIHHGKITGEGTHNELLKTNELYRVLNRTEINGE